MVRGAARTEQVELLRGLNGYRDNTGETVRLTTVAA